MPAIYGYERFNYPTTKFVHLKSAVTGGLDAKAVGAIVDVTNSTGTGAVLADKSGVAWTAGHTYYLVAEIPADATDYGFVGVILRDQGMVDNLVPRRPRQDWAKQFYDLKTGGVK